MDRIEVDVLRQLRRFGAPQGLPELLAAWPETVGPDIARHAWPARIARDGTLHVATSSATWAFELTHLAPRILEQLREALGDQAPPALRFAAGHLPERPPEREEPTAATSLTPGPEDVSEAAMLAAEIDDEELREHVARAASLSLFRARSGRSVW